jgi:hypothetical protein
MVLFPTRGFVPRMDVPPRPRDTEDVLRSLGAVLDSVRARSVLLRESDDGFILHASIAVTLRDRLDGRWTSLERPVPFEELRRYQREALARRGSGHVAGPHERSLRMIGRHIDEQLLRQVALFQHQTEGCWLLWHGSGEAGPALLTLDDDRLLIEDARQASARQARQATDGGRTTPRRVPPSGGRWPSRRSSGMTTTGGQR